MLSKIAIVLFVAHAITASHLGGPQQQLQLVIKQLTNFVRADIAEASISIQANLSPLTYYTNQARENVISGLTEDARPYWTKIAELQEQAGNSSCIDEGMELFFKLNETAIVEPINTINNLFNEGNATVFRSFDEVDAVNQDLKDLTTRANACHDDACAADLVKEAILFYSSYPKTIDAAIAESTQYAQVDVVKKLATVQIDKASYVSQYNVILGQVQACINN